MVVVACGGMLTLGLLLGLIAGGCGGLFGFRWVGWFLCITVISSSFRCGFGMVGFG